MAEDIISEEALECVMSYVDDPRDRSVVSQVCKKWYAINALTRKHVTVAFFYTIRPYDLTRRFKRLESLKLKGKPRATMFNLIREDWGGYARLWIDEISTSCQCLKRLHLRHMIVKDDDLAVLMKSHGHMLLAVKLEKCFGLSTPGLLAIARACRSLKVLLLEESLIKDKGGEWLHELALWNSSLKVLNFYLTGLESTNLSDLELLATNCRSLTSLRVNECDILDLRGVLEKATELEEFGGGSFCSSDENGADENKDGTLVDLIGLNKLKNILSAAGIDVLYNVPVVHCREAFGVVLQAIGRKNNANEIVPGWKVVYSGDTRPCKNLRDAAFGATVLIHEDGPRSSRIIRDCSLS